jgi:hypothetical protein
LPPHMLDYTHGTRLPHVVNTNNSRIVLPFCARLVYHPWIMSTPTKTHLHIRIFTDELEKLQKAAKMARKTLTQWVREACLAELRRQSK